MVTAVSRSVRLGQRVPDFSCASTAGDWRLAATRGKARVLYFYPRDNTSGCTQEAADFRDLEPQFRKAGAVIAGVSSDSLKSHEKFRDKMRLPFPLLADEERTMCRMFDVIREKSLYGRKFMGIERSTFVIDGAGVLRHEWRKVKVANHAQEVLAAVRAL